MFYFVLGSNVFLADKNINNMKMIILSVREFVLFLFIGSLYAQVFIKDTAMRRILAQYKVMQGDSMLTNRVGGWLQPEFKCDYIHDLTGLSYFTQVWKLTIQTKQCIEK